MSFKEPNADCRKFARFELIECAMLYEEGREEPYRAVVVDIGLGGLQVRSKEVLPIGTVCKVHIGRDGRRPFELEGEIRYSLPLVNTELISSGIKFKPSTHEQRVAVAEYVHGVFQRQGESLIG